MTPIYTVVTLIVLGIIALIVVLEKWREEDEDNDNDFE